MPDLFVSKDEFKSLLDTTNGAIAASGEHLALQCFHVSVSKTKLTIAASDQANTIISSIPGEYEDTFDFLAPAQKIQPIVRLASPGLLQLSVEKNSMHISAANSSWEVKIPTAVTFPKVPKCQKADVEVSAEIFRDAIRATRRSMAETPLRPQLRMLSVRKGAMVACDGARLSQASLGEDFPRDFSASIPLSSVGLVWDLVKDESLKSVGIADLPNHSVFIAGETQVLTKKLTSSFPNVEQIMLRPALENKQSFTVARAEILKAVDRVRINADSSTDAIGLSLSEKSITVTARDVDGNTGSETIPSTWAGKDRLLIVNHKYLTSLIRGVQGENCHFFLGEDTKSRKSVVLLKDEEKQIYGLIPQFSGNLRVL
jgi:DNA polymerase III sliding clamp (beta) subunit (PCNA family)